MLILIDCVSAFDLWPFKPKKFSGTALVGAGSLGLSNDERVVAFGDFNGDQLSVLLYQAVSVLTLFTVLIL